MLWPNEKCVEEYRKERLRQAEHERLVRLVCGNPSRKDRFYCRFLLWLGRWMVAWGTGLQQRYSFVVDENGVRSTAKEISA